MARRLGRIRDEPSTIAAVTCTWCSACLCVTVVKEHQIKNEWNAKLGFPLCSTAALLIISIRRSEMHHTAEVMLPTNLLFLRLADDVLYCCKQADWCVMHIFYLPFIRLAYFLSCRFYIWYLQYLPVALILTVFVCDMSFSLFIILRNCSCYAPVQRFWGGVRKGPKQPVT